MDYEFIEIVYNSNPYLAPIGLKHDLNNQAIIDMKKRQNIFEWGKLRFTTSLYPIEGRRYVEIVRKIELDSL